jgi:hypothetical protein
MNPNSTPRPAGRQLTTSTRTLVVGDIHGCFDELLSLIQAAGISASDRIVSVGDLIDRGPQPWEVVDFFRARPESRHAILGNHEWKHLRHEGNPDIPSRSAAETRRVMGEARYAEALDYFHTLPLWLELPEVRVVHAGVDPLLPPEETDPKLILGINSRWRPGFDGLSPWWFDDPRLTLAKPVVFGHHVFPEVARGERGNVWGINTGAGYGEPLTGLLLPEFRIVSVPTANHAASIPKRWESAEDLRKIPLLPWKRVFQLLENPDRLPAPALALLEEARDDLDALVARLQQEGLALRDAYRVQALSPQEKGELIRGLRAEPRFATPYGKILLHSILSKGASAARQYVVKPYPTPQSLRDVAAGHPPE